MHSTGILKSPQAIKGRDNVSPFSRGDTWSLTATCRLAVPGNLYGTTMRAECAFQGPRSTRSNENLMYIS